MKQIEFILSKLATVPKDKLLHFFFGSLIFFITSITITLAGFNSLVTLGTSISFTFVLAVFKEMYDKLNPDKHSVDVLDVIFTILPSIIYSLLFLIMSYV